MHTQNKIGRAAIEKAIVPIGRLLLTNGLFHAFAFKPAQLVVPELLLLSQGPPPSIYRKVV
jgi:hypothetical protein